MSTQILQHGWVSHRLLSFIWVSKSGETISQQMLTNLVKLQLLLVIPLWRRRAWMQLSARFLAINAIQVFVGAFIILLGIKLTRYTVRGAAWHLTLRIPQTRLAAHGIQPGRNDEQSLPRFDHC